MKLIPLFDRVVLQKIEKPNTTKINLLTVSNHTPDEYQVVALGVGGKIDGNEINFQIQVGDKVLFNKYSGSDFCLEKDEYVIVKQEDIIAIIKD